LVVPVLLVLLFGDVAGILLVLEDGRHWRLYRPDAVGALDGEGEEDEEEEEGRPPGDDGGEDAEPGLDVVEGGAAEAAVLGEVGNLEGVGDDVEDVADDEEDGGLFEGTS
jgi:hypothetical protein